MCGIAGLFNQSGQPVEQKLVEDMCDLMTHRGPDDSGLWCSGQIALGHRRLSIIDLSPRGRNPMANEDGTVQVVFNGEIYNYREIRDELKRRGHLFKSESDTEVIVHLYEEFGLGCVEKLNGMFAFALYDGRRRNEKGSDLLLLARDRFGVKPLYYTAMNGMFAFASEIKAFTALPGFEPRPDHCGIYEHFTFQNTFGMRTLFKGVNLLPPGHLLSCSVNGHETTCYWDLKFDPDNSRTLDQFAEGLHERFENAVTRQLVSDVPIGSFLSGGMDTGAISAVAVRHIPSIHTFTCGFKLPQAASELEKFFDERTESYNLADILGTTHHDIELGPNSLVPALPHVIWHLDEPRVGISYQVYYTSELISNYVKVVLSGVGGDELFAGYPWRYQNMLDVKKVDFDSTYYPLSVRFLDDAAKRELFTPEFLREVSGYSTFDSFRSVTRNTRDFDPLHKALYFDFKTFLNGLLIVDDKLSMSHSIESRVPFLDNELVDYVSRIPSKYKLDKQQSKVVLRRAMRGVLPADTITRRKQGFTPPDQTWYKENLFNYIRELILGTRALERGYFLPASIEAILEDHIANRKNNRFLIWSLMCFEWWNRLFIDGEKLPEKPAPASGRAS